MIKPAYNVTEHIDNLKKMIDALVARIDFRDEIYTNQLNIIKELQSLIIREIKEYSKQEEKKPVPPPPPPPIPDSQGYTGGRVYNTFYDSLKKD